MGCRPRTARRSRWRSRAFNMLSDFATDPEFATSPDLYIRGIAPSASTVDVLVNNVPYITGEHVPTGPFVLQVPAFGLDGQGQIQLVVHDALGNAHIIRNPSMAAARCSKPASPNSRTRPDCSAKTSRLSVCHRTQNRLRPGRSAMDSPTGDGRGPCRSRLRRGDGRVHDGRGRAGDRTRHGGHCRLSFAPLGAGVRAVLGAQFRAEAASRFRRRSRILALRSERSAPTTTSGAERASVCDGAVRGLFLSGGDVSAQQFGRTSSFATFGLGGRIAGGTMSLSATQGLHGAPSSYYAGFAARVGRTSINTVASSSRVSTLVQGDAPPSGYGSTTGISINKEPGSSPFIGAAYGFDSPIIHFDATADWDSLLATVRGGIMFVGGKVSVARELVGSYGIAVVPGYANVRVSVNGLEVGRTDRNGVVALPFLVPFNVNRITVNQDDLPISAN